MNHPFPGRRRGFLDTRRAAHWDDRRGLWKRRFPRRGRKRRAGDEFRPGGAAGSRHRSLVLGALAAAVAVALVVAALRTEILRTRYELARVAEEETRLLRERRELLVTVRRLRSPQRLAGVAAELGFAAPERLIELGAPSRGEGRP